ncbi:TIGR01620 family protein [Alphaproteobacteria bacterium GH1-50]|uniref:TIGR01620 family protein n=1 Tax=Kangsaoukella pontilimi TaxID=2691042 RepID=A0A7C9MF71_9RHOB|nr:TIGR01620 family protein [Kangsaoukella pontilimi]MXQ09331.1 TIGR01620 family protein [Kangsaoukella pontilimi]
MDNRRDGPVLIELDDAPRPSPAEAPPIEDDGTRPTGQAMHTVAAIAARRPSRLTRWFWQLLTAVVVFFVSVALWDWVTSLVQRNEVLGWAALGLVGLFLAVCLAIILREAAALTRLKRIEHLHIEAERVLADGDLAAARALVGKLKSHYAGREDMRWGLDRLAKSDADVFDADAALALAEDALLTPLDALARREVEAAARQVATVTALVPLAFADVAAALTSNLRMIRRIAEIYGGRSGTLGTWRLTRAVITHLVATGAVAVGDDLISSVGGGHLLSKLSRRFGEGLVNGALTARVGVAAIEVCRPLPFLQAKRPRVTALVQRALTGLFDRDGTPGAS